jgi:integrase
LARRPDSGAVAGNNPPIRLQLPAVGDGLGSEMNRRRCGAIIQDRGFRRVSKRLALKLPQAALDIIAAQPCIARNPYSFAGNLRGRRPKKDTPKKDLPTGPAAFNSFGQRKAELDAKLADMPHWTLHDLRRTARSLMAEAGVSENVAERVLGHALPGVRGVYNRYDYADEKADALQRLAAKIETIVNPPSGNNVVTFAR